MKLPIPKIWKGKTVTIVGGGPSLNGFDFGRLEGIVVGTNHSPKFHRADMLVAIDQKFHEREGEWLDGLSCLKVTQNPTHREDFIKVELEPDYENPHEDHDWTVLRANLSGFLALAVSLHLGAENIFLLGFDGGYTAGKETPNFHPYHYEGPGMNFYTPQNQYYDFYKDRKIINVGMYSRIAAFKRVDLKSDFYGLVNG